MSQWWHLPIEVVDCILKHVSFLDYVALTQTNSSLRELLNNTRVLQLVLSANFAQKIDSFEWSFTDIDRCLEKKNLWRSYRQLDSFLGSVDGISLLDSPSLDQMQLQRNIHKFGADEIYLVPLMMIYDLLDERLTESLFKRGVKIHISRVSWTQLLLHLQNFRKAINFFHDAGSGIPSSIERSLFEVSRADLNFPQLVHSRTAKLYHIRRQVRHFLPTSKGSITFANWPAFLKFLKEVVIVIVKALPKPKGQWPALNILRAYEGDGIAGDEMIMAMVAKILTEEIFKKFRIKVNDRMTEFLVRPSAIMIWVGPIEVRLMTDPVDVQIYARAVDPTLLVSPLAPLTTERMLKNIDTSEPLQDPMICYKFPWKPTTLRWKYFVEKFTESLSNKPLSAGFDFDLLSFFYHAVLDKQDRQYVSNSKNVLSLLCMLDGGEQNKFEIGQLVINSNLGYIGTIILMDDKNKSYRVCPHDFTRIYIAQESSLYPVKQSQMGNSTLQWLLRSEGFVFSGTCLFRYMEFKGENIVLS